jgi:hypothetical protein
MKVKCIYNKGWEKWLTIGKTYDALIDNEYGYVIINDYGVRDWNPKEWFKLLSEIRIEKINKLLGI